MAFGVGGIQPYLFQKRKSCIQRFWQNRMTHIISCRTRNTARCLYEKSRNDRSECGFRPSRGNYSGTYAGGTRVESGCVITQGRSGYHHLLNPQAPLSKKETEPTTVGAGFGSG